jgi:hypothetical protein
MSATTATSRTARTIDPNLVRFNPLEVTGVDPIDRLTAFAVLTYTADAPRVEQVPVGTLLRVLLEVTHATRPGSSEALVSYRTLDASTGPTIPREQAVDLILDVLAAAVPAPNAVVDLPA